MGQKVIEKMLEELRELDGRNDSETESFYDGLSDTEIIFRYIKEFGMEMLFRIIIERLDE